MSGLRAWIANPWGRPRFLVLVTWLYVLWSLVPVAIAIAFSFNDGRSRTAWQGFSLRWYYSEPGGSVWNDESLRNAMWHSLELAVLAMLIATPLGVALAIGLQRWRTRAGAGANVLMLIPLVTPELVMGASLFLLFTQLFGVIGLGTTAQVIGQVTFSVSFVVVMIRGRLSSIGPEFEEAAADLGAPPRDALVRVLLPLLMPAVVASMLVVFALSIDDFVVTSYLSRDASTETVPIKLYSAARGAPTPALNALAAIMVALTLLSLLVALLVYRRFARGSGGSALEAIGGR